MENRRFFLIAVFGALLFFTYQTWQKDFPARAPVAAATPASTTPAATAPGEDALPSAPAAASKGVTANSTVTRLNSANLHR